MLGLEKCYLDVSAFNTRPQPK